MPDTQYKSKTIAGLTPTEPAIGSLLPMTPMRWAPFGALMRAQDAVLATSRRVVAEWSQSGAQTWSAPESTAAAIIAGATDVPGDDWRSLGTYFAHVTPGCELAAYALCSPAGITQETTQPTGNWGDVRIGVTWTNGASTTGPHYRTAPTPGSQVAEGDAATGAGQDWSQTSIIDCGRHRPPGYLDTPATTAAYSEWSDVEIEIAIRGNPRLTQVVVHERPLSHCTVHDNDGLTSAHAAPLGLGALTPGPLTRAPDGATYEEHRHGTERTMQVAERQSERLGPRIMHWVCWDETDTDVWDQSEGNPVDFTLTAFRHVLDSSLSTTDYDEDTPGWISAGSYAQLARLCDPTCIARGGFAVVPVRVRVDASRAVGNGVVRVQCGPYDWVDVSVTSTRATYTATGYIESQATGDHEAYPIAVYGRVLAGGSTLSVYGVSVDFGTWDS